ncbi:hypothetical protein ACXN5S_05670 [Pseudoroseicyclus sp. H15]
MALFTGLDYHGAALGVAGGIMVAERARWVLAEGADCVAIGRAGILADDLPRRIAADPAPSRQRLCTAKAWATASSLISAPSATPSKADRAGPLPRHPGVTAGKARAPSQGVSGEAR